MFLLYLFIVFMFMVIHRISTLICEIENSNLFGIDEMVLKNIHNIFLKFIVMYVRDTDLLF